MTDRPAKLPDSTHPISIEPFPGRVVVRVGGHVVADTRRALTLREASYPAVHYVPREDADMSLLLRSERRTYCPYKGDCAYYSIPTEGRSAQDAVWSYEAPYPAVAAIRDHLAFYPDRVDEISVNQST
jgi:uncharacterized protein (DUF427 family)